MKKNLCSGALIVALGERGRAGNDERGSEDRGDELVHNAPTFSHSALNTS